jgi:hypothetical protein
MINFTKFLFIFNKVCREIKKYVFVQQKFDVHLKNEKSSHNYY